MIFDAVPATSLHKKAQGGIRLRALSAFIGFIERKLGASVVLDARQFPYDRADLLEAWELASKLREIGVIQSAVKPWVRPPDEPPLKAWTAVCNDPTAHQTAGASTQSDLQALMATLAEALERYIWFTQNDYFKYPVRARADELNKSHVAPERFAGFSQEQRENGGQLLMPSASYLWTQGISLISNRPIYVPVQTVSGFGRLTKRTEPIIRQSTTVGLATWPTKVGAQLAGVLEAIERDAYMIMWLNQLTLPRVALDPILKRNASLKAFVERCERYRLKTHVVQMLTDAPTHAVCVILEDMSGVAPRFAFGLRADRSLDRAIEKAMTEALRARSGYRRYASEGNQWDAATPVEKIGHRERVYYWGLPEHAKLLEFLIQGKEQTVTDAPWGRDSTAEHLDRIVRWCREVEYECVSVPLTSSSKNPTQWHIESMVIPELQSVYLLETYRAFGGTRLRSIPEKFGYAPLEKPHSSSPHPFA